MISILRDKKGKLAKSEQDQCKTSTHCDADKRNNCPSFANRDGFESGTKLNNITHFATATNSLGKNSLSIDAGWGKLNCASVFKQKCHVAGPWTTSEIQAEKRNNYRQINQREEILVSKCFYVQVTKVSFHLPKECRTSGGTFAGGMPPAFR